MADKDRPNSLLLRIRSTQAYERVFKESGLTIVRDQIQHGLPDELFVVKMWALR